jgi:sensor domain CHASE-containing protein
MTLHKKTLVVTSLTLLWLLGLLYIASQIILNRSFQQLEEQYAIQNVQRASHTLQNDINAFKLIALGWSKWDDVYQFVSDKNQAFIDNNLTDTTFVDSDLDLMMFIDKQNKLLFAKAFDNDLGKAVPVSEVFDQLAEPTSQLVRHTGITSEYAGFVKLQNGYLITLSLPILTSLSEGPINGTLIWGRYLNDTRIAQLSSALEVNVTLSAYDDASLPLEVREAELNLSPDHPYFTIPVDSTLITGYTAINVTDWCDLWYCERCASRS